MHRIHTSTSIAAALLLAAATAPAAEQANPAEARLREAVRSLTLQVRTSQGERDTAVAAQAEAEQKRKELDDELKKLKKLSEEQNQIAEKTREGLEAAVAAKTTEIASLKENLQKTQSAEKKAAELARTKEAERAKLAANVVELQRKVADRETKNAELFKVGNEILSRYEKFGLGTALTAREPFVGLTRVKLQNLIQDFSDKLADQKLKP